MTARTTWTPRKPSKYRAKPCEVDGRRFASRKEGRRYVELRLLEQAGVIMALRCQPRYPLFAVGTDGKSVVAGTFVADFVYQQDGRLVVEDVKSPVTRKLSTYRLKKRIVEANYGFEVQEV